MNLRVFLRNERGSSFESLALALSVIAVLSVATADFLHYSAKKDGLLARLFANTHSQFAGAGNTGQGLRGDIDYTSTGSIVGLRHLPSIEPCTGTTK